MKAFPMRHHQVMACIIVTLALAGCGQAAEGSGAAAPKTGAAVDFPPASVAGLSRLSDEQAYYLWDASGHGGFNPSKPKSPAEFVDAVEAERMRHYPQDFGISASTIKNHSLYNYAQIGADGQVTPTATPSAMPGTFDAATGMMTSDGYDPYGLLQMEVFTLNDDFVVDRNAVTVTAKNSFSDSPPLTDIPNTLYNPGGLIGIGRHRMVVASYSKNGDKNSLEVMKQVAKTLQDSGALG